MRISKRPIATQERRQDSHVEVPAEAAQRLDGLLLEVVDRELEGIVAGVAQAVAAVVVRGGRHVARHPGPWVGEVQPPAAPSVLVAPTRGP